MEEATSKLRMGLHVGPTKYQPASLKYIRAEEEEDDDVEAPYLAPRDITKAKNYPEDDLLSISSGSLPDLIDLEEEEPPCQPLTSMRSGNAICPATLALNKATAATLTEKLTPSLLSPERPEGKHTLKATQERPVAKEDIPEESIIHIDDDLEPFPLANANDFFPGFLVRNICETVAYGACTVLWGMFVRGLRVETFVRVLRSSRVNLNKCK